MSISLYSRLFIISWIYPYEQLPPIYSCSQHFLHMQNVPDTIGNCSGWGHSSWPCGTHRAKPIISPSSVQPALPPKSPHLSWENDQSTQYLNQKPLSYPVILSIINLHIHFPELVLSMFWIFLESILSTCTSKDLS